jgi:mycothione reductase
VQDNVKMYDVLVIGTGSGMEIVESALNSGMTVALVDKGPIGGTCNYLGCIPSKMLTAVADRVMDIREASRLGISAQVRHVDFNWAMENMRAMRAEDAERIHFALHHTPNLDFYHTVGRFVGERTMRAGDSVIRGEKVFIVAGARPAIPAIEGLHAVRYLDNESVLELTELPDSLLMIGGGYINCEYAHFFEAMGTKVTILQSDERLVPDEEPEISDLLARKLSERMEVHTLTEAVAVRRANHGYVVTGRNPMTGETREFRAEQLMVATGRTPYTDLLEVQRTGVETDERGYIRVNEYLETNVPNIWAYGDVIGKKMFRHSANREALVAWHNSVHDHRVALDYGVVPHAVFSYPPIASVGLTEAEASRDHQILVGISKYTDVAKGIALHEHDGFAKAIVDAETEQILGFHIIGPYAPILIQEVINNMALEHQAADLHVGLHIHPAMSELIPSTLSRLDEPE